MHVYPIKYPILKFCIIPLQPTGIIYPDAFYSGQVRVVSREALLKCVSGSLVTVQGQKQMFLILVVWLIIQTKLKFFIKGEAGLSFSEKKVFT